MIGGRILGLWLGGGPSANFVSMRYGKTPDFCYVPCYYSAAGAGIFRPI
jgi:hypothetical protein